MLIFHSERSLKVVATFTVPLQNFVGVSIGLGVSPEGEKVPRAGFARIQVSHVNSAHSPTESCVV